MHLYYNAHDKSDLTKLGELLNHECRLRGADDDKSDSPDPGGLEKEVNLIFRTINGVNAVVGFIFLLSGVIVFFEFRKPEANFGSSAFVVVSFVLGLCGVTFCLYSAFGFLLNIRSLQQMLLYTIGGGFVFIAMIFACSVRIPSTSDLLRNVSSEMTDSVYLGRKGDPTQQAKWKYIQTSLQCCGVTNYLDWCEPRNVTIEQQGIGRQCSVPPSCFRNASDYNPEPLLANSLTRRSLFVRGCYSLQMEMLHLNITLYRSFGYLMIILVVNIFFFVFFFSFIWNYEILLNYLLL